MGEGLFHYYPLIAEQTKEETSYGIFQQCSRRKGAIFVVPDARLGEHLGEFGYLIVMSGASDLSSFALKYPEELRDNPDRAEKYADFIDKYQKCYVPSKGYEYYTHFSVPNSVNADQLKTTILEQIAHNCPLAYVGRNGIVYNKDIFR